MQVDIAVRTIACTKAATDAPVFNKDFQRIAATNGPHRAAHHAERIAALPARGRDEVLIEAEAVADQPGHAVMSVGASIHTGVAAGALLQVEHQQALRFHQSLREELIDGHVELRLHALLVLGAAFSGNFFETLTHAREKFDHLAEIVARDAQDFDMVERNTCCRAQPSSEQANFAEKIAAREIREDELPSRMIFGNFHETESDDIEVIRGITLAGNDLAGRVTLEHDVFFQIFYEFGREVGEHRHAAKMVFKCAAAVIQIDLRAESFILQHDVQNVPQHLECDNVRFRADGGGTRIKIHAGHFAEEVARTELSDGIAVCQIHGRIDGDRSVACLFFALVLLASHQAAAEPLEETFCAAVSLYVRDWTGNGNFGLPFEDIKGG